MDSLSARETLREWSSGWVPEAAVGRSRPVNYSPQACPGTARPVRGPQPLLPVGARIRATARPPAASAPGSSFQAVPPEAGLLRADLEPRDLPGPTPRYRQPWKTRTEADRT